MLYLGPPLVVGAQDFLGVDGDLDGVDAGLRVAAINSKVASFFMAILWWYGEMG